MIKVIDQHRIIGIAGNAKNAGKTTVLNTIIKESKAPLILTSIGLDGEQLDQVTHLEKPQVYVRVNDIVISAKDTFKQWQATYEIIEETNIFTAIGPVCIAKITGPGKVLIAGPSLVSDVLYMINHIRYDYDYKILIDGAFSRMSFGVVTDAIIYVVGANYHASMDQTIQAAANEYKKLTVEHVPSVYANMIKTDRITVIKKNHVLHLSVDSAIGRCQALFEYIDDSVKAIYFPKALTDAFVELWTKNFHRYRFDIIVQTGIHIQLNQHNLKNLLTLCPHIYACKPIKVTGICINPYAPQGYHYDAKLFKERLSQALGIDVINVKEGEQNE